MKRNRDDATSEDYAKVIDTANMAALNALTWDSKSKTGISNVEYLALFIYLSKFDSVNGADARRALCAWRNKPNHYYIRYFTWMCMSDMEGTHYVNHLWAYSHDGKIRLLLRGFEKAEAALERCRDTFKRVNDETWKAWEKGEL